MKVLNKLLLFRRIKKFYNIFGSEIGTSHITKLSEMTIDNVRDVIFDLNEVLADYEADKNTAWLYKLRFKVINFCDI